MRLSATRSFPPRRLSGWIYLPIVWIAVGSCVTNPATGRKMFSLISESQEIAMGQKYSEQIDATMGLYDDPELQAYVERVGLALAAVAERPQLPWSFKIVDDPVVNAFALPGGPVYLTRGILAYFSSEAEMAAVLGHEIGHITARHSVEQMSRAQVFNLGLAVGSIASSAIARNIENVGAGLQVLFLSYSRGDEHQSDMLGIRYASRSHYDVREAVSMHEKLGRLTAMRGGPGIPDWLSTHPSSEDRIERLEAQADTFPVSYFATAKLGAAEYLAKVDGIVYGENPRQGFFQGARFLHPDLRFRIDFPSRWDSANLPQSVMAQSPNQDALVALRLADADGHQNAASEFFDQDGVTASGVRATTINGLPATTGQFRARTNNAVFEGLAAFIDFAGTTYQILGYTIAGRFGTYDDSFRASIQSFRELKDQRALDVQPLRVQLMTLRRDASIAEIARSKPTPVTLAELAVINGVAEDETLPAGTTIKWVAGEPPPQ